MSKLDPNVGAVNVPDPAGCKVAKPQDYPPYAVLTDSRPKAPDQVGDFPAKPAPSDDAPQAAIEEDDVCDDPFCPVCTEV